MRDGSASGDAHGKLIFLGEHAVVYGMPALVVGVELKLNAELCLTSSGGQVLHLLDRQCVADPNADDELPRAFAALLSEGKAPSHLELRVTGALPPGVGMGFSAAAAVAMARALESANGCHESNVVRRAAAWEAVFHGNASGIDVAAAMRNGFARFSRKDGLAPMPSITMPWLCVALTGVRSSTREQVKMVARLQQSEPEHHRQSIEAIGALVESGIEALKIGDDARLGKLMDRNQSLLQGLQVSTAKIEKLCALARDAGALGAKLTGAGGGGAVVALAGRGEAGSQIAHAMATAFSDHGVIALIVEGSSGEPGHVDASPVEICA